MKGSRIIPAIRNLAVIKAIEEISERASFTITNVAPHKMVIKRRNASDLYLIFNFSVH